MEPGEQEQDLQLVRRLRRCGHLLHHIYNFSNGSQMRILPVSYTHLRAHET